MRQGHSLFDTRAHILLLRSVQGLAGCLLLQQAPHLEHSKLLNEYIVNFTKQHFSTSMKDLSRFCVMLCISPNKWLPKGHCLLLKTSEA